MPLKSSVKIVGTLLFLTTNSCMVPQREELIWVSSSDSVEFTVNKLQFEVKSHASNTVITINITDNASCLMFVVNTDKEKILDYCAPKTAIPKADISSAKLSFGDNNGIITGLSVEIEYGDWGNCSPKPGPRPLASVLYVRGRAPTLITSDPENCLPLAYNK